MTQSVQTPSHVTYRGRGITCRQDIEVEVHLKQPGHGLVFEVFQNGQSCLLPAKTESVVHTLRNVVLGKDGIRLCIVEHFLAATSLCNLNDLLVKVHGPEMPLGDGSARFWMELFTGAGWVKELPEARIELKQPIVCGKADKLLMAIPDERFSLSYHMDWNHPAIGKRWQSWDASCKTSDIADARTFGWLKEHQLLGIADEVVSLTPDGFSQPLRFEDEPVRHKILDLLGDLALSGVNPMVFKARFVSMKAGHELDVEMARQLAAVLSQS